MSCGRGDQQKLLTRIRRARGQMDALERAIESGARAEAVMHLIAGVRGSMASLMSEVLEHHLRAHLSPNEADEQAEHLIQVVQTYMK